MTINIPVASAAVYKKRTLHDKDVTILKQDEMESLPLFVPTDSHRQGNIHFNTKNCPPVIKEMKGFEEGMIHITENMTSKKKLKANSGKT